jgi:transposase InsO family protein
MYLVNDLMNTNAHRYPCSSFTMVSTSTQVRALPTYHANAITNVDVLTIVKDKHGYQYAFVFINSFTKYTLIFPAKDKTAKTCAMCMLSHALTVGVTECKWTDQGPEFCAEVTQELARILGITRTFSLAYRPQSNGIVGRQNSEILRRLRTLILHKETWNCCWSEPHVIALVQLALNTRVHGTTGYAAVELTFGAAARQYHKSPNALRQGRTYNHINTLLSSFTFQI